MPHWDEDPVLLATQRQWRVIAGAQGLPGLQSAVAQATAGTWASGFVYPFADPNIQLYSSVGDAFDVRHGTSTKGLYAVSPTLQPSNQSTPTQAIAGGALFSPPVGGSMAMLPVGPIIGPAVGGFLAALRALAVKVTQQIGASGGFGAALRTGLGALGVTQIYDMIDQSMPWASEEQKEMGARVLAALAELESAGFIHPWNPRPRRDGTPTGGPYYMVMDLVAFQGHYTNFHMSRKGLTRHDEKQDTPKRPRTAGRSRRNQH